MRILANPVLYELHCFVILESDSSKQRYFYHPIPHPRNQTTAELNCYIKLFLHHEEVDVLLIAEPLTVDKLRKLHR